jgi:glycerol kinase
VRQRTGLVIDPYFSATKVEWLLENVAGLRERARDGGARFGTIDAWLAFKLTGRAVTDFSNASRTMLFDIHTLSWDADLCAALGVPVAALPEAAPSAHALGETDPGSFLGARVALAGMAGDQQAALFGQACLDPGLGKNTYGTGSFVLQNAGAHHPPVREGLLTTVAWGVEGRVDYALEASVFVTGAAVQWLRDGLGIIREAAETEALAGALESNEGVYFVPALTGLGSPHWDPYARGTIVGLTRGSRREHLARAALEAIAYQTVDAVQAMEAASGRRMAELRADGGAVANAWLMQFQADVLGRPVVVPETAETTALGAAYLAGVGAGEWTPADVRELWREGARYEPRMGDDERESLLHDWRRALERARGWAR